MTRTLIAAVLFAVGQLFRLPQPTIHPAEPPEPPFVAQPIPLIAPPPSPQLTADGRALILEFETGGKSGYQPRPEWPGFASGVTVGIGYDCGYNSAAVILLDWKLHDARTRLASVAGIHGSRARPYAAQLHDILTSWDLATDVFNEVTVARFSALCARTFPGFTALHPDAQAAILSVVFNRGNSLAGPRRVEMRAIHDAMARWSALPEQQRAAAFPALCQAIAFQLRKMKAIWQGTDIAKGMTRRREAEARLVEQAATEAVRLKVSF